MNELQKGRFMRIICFFDLPVKTAKQRRDYRLFRKFLLKDGYLSLQESVYSKLVINEATSGYAISRLRKNRPPEGLVQVLKVSEAQFASMEYITGERELYDEIDTTEELLVL